MTLQDDNTLIDDREPVTLLGIRRENLPFSVERLQNRGTKVTRFGFIDEDTDDAIEKINRQQRVGLITASQAERRKNRLRSNRGDVRDQAINTGAYAITLKYGQPNVSVDSSTRFTEHATIDGPIIRQRIGPGLVEVAIEGVCTTTEAAILDNLRFEDTVEVISERYNGEVQIAAASTSPLEDGGAIDLDGQFTHTFGIELVEVNR